MTTAIGWLSSAVLLMTLTAQIHKQWVEKTSRGVSRWLFAGQVVAEVGFVAYSVLLENWVFAATNAALLVVNFVGLWITLHFKSRQAP